MYVKATFLLPSNKNCDWMFPEFYEHPFKVKAENNMYLHYILASIIKRSFFKNKSLYIKNKNHLCANTNEIKSNN